MDRAGQGGAVLAGRYRVEGALELEGEAITVPALDLAVSRVLIRAFRLGAGASVGAALALACAATQIESERVERVLDAGLLDARTIFLVTEPREGVELFVWVESAGPLRTREAIACVAEACAAVREAHARGVCHGDLSPERLVLSPRPDGRRAIKVTGFGEPRRAPTLFRAPEVRGPEAIPTARADLWSLGAVLFYLLTGAAPPDVPDLRARRPSVPVALERVVLRCLEADPRARYASAAELSRALAFFLPAPMADDAPAPRARMAWIRAVAALAIMGFAAFTGLAFSTASAAEVANALRPLEAIVGPIR